MPSYNNPEHPEHKEWVLARRKRFIAIVREGKRICKLLPEERELVIQLCKLMEKNHKNFEEPKEQREG